MFYQHTDALGTPVAQTDASGQIVARTTYTPYGSLHSATQPEYGPGYAGRYDDPTGLVYMHRRYYDPELHRFISPDPIGADASTGINFNRYAYANNSPYRYYDPSGRSAEDDEEDEVEETEKEEPTGEPEGDDAGGESDSAPAYCSEVPEACEDRATILGGIREVQTNIGQGVEVADAVAVDIIQEAPLNLVGGAMVKAAATGIKILKGAMVEEKVAEVAEEAATSFKYEDISTTGSRYANRATDASRNDFEQNLLDTGWARSASKDGSVTIFEKDGAKYVLRDNAKSTGGPTADFYGSGSDSIDLKIRLEFEP